MTAAERRSLHDRILGDIEARIFSGAWPPGNRVPSESELAAAYGCSRMTVNKVLSVLARAGLVQRRRKAGTVVRQPPMQSAMLEIPDLRQEVTSLGLDYRYLLLSRARKKAGVSQAANPLGSEPGSPLLELGCLHFAGPRPFCFERRLIDLTAVPEAAGEPFDEMAPGAWLLERVPWSQAEHTIMAVGADEAAAALDVPLGTPCLVIERRTWRQRSPVTHVILTYPGGSHRLTARFAPSGA